VSAATDATSGASSARGRALTWIEVVATVLLASATVATAWSGYQATRWGGEATKASSRTNAARISASRSADLANTQKQVDLAVFTAWADAYATGEVLLVEFYANRFREEFQPAMDAWIATRPLQNSEAPASPFAMPEYQLAADDETARQDALAEENSAQTRRNIQRQSNYVLGVVLFATALFFAGMSSKVDSRPARIAVLAMGCIVFVGTLIWVVTMPVTVSI